MGRRGRSGRSSFCDLVDRYVIPIGTMAGHTSDADVVEQCRLDQLV
jgi:hypothetical protein